VSFTSEGGILFASVGLALLLVLKVKFDGCLISFPEKQKSPVIPDSVFC